MRPKADATPLRNAVMSNRNPGPAPIWDDALNPTDGEAGRDDSGKLLRSGAHAGADIDATPDDSRSAPRRTPRAQPGGSMRGWMTAGALTGILLGAGTAALLFLPKSEPSIADPALVLVAAEQAESTGDATTARSHYERLVTSHPESPEAAIARRALRRIR